MTFSPVMFWCYLADTDRVLQIAPNRPFGLRGVTTGTPHVLSRKIRRVGMPLSLRPRPLRHSVYPNI
jgi:hypothetical protein